MILFPNSAFAQSDVSSEAPQARLVTVCEPAFYITLTRLVSLCEL